MLFWTSRGWDGSGEMIALSSPYCIHLPPHSRIALFSGEFTKTIIATLQGAQIVASLSLSVGGTSGGYVVYMGVDLIFFPLAFIGLVRLFCAFWLTDKFAYIPLVPYVNLVRITYRHSHVYGNNNLRRILYRDKRDGMWAVD
ncbi:uncharacterized protein F4817DRAFT_178504 [Daldinia loculata]|uniref:uncharacterized protein n=1 Tax=Daldinia loculata TaxID=103429 RepID=UPI0020C1EDB4|nr:uncharacterized protein F4817DRAFT_178504 [Daldinia loculata]KAI1651199.1 hypothetical protein F4817DRAFT_178504 [Daldinia loculata]